jgi:hypothetical protein
VSYADALDKSMSFPQDFHSTCAVPLALTSGIITAGEEMSRFILKKIKKLFRRDAFDGFLSEFSCGELSPVHSYSYTFGLMTQRTKLQGIELPRVAEFESITKRFSFKVPSKQVLLL